MRKQVLAVILAAGMPLPMASLAGDGVVALQTAKPSCRTTTIPPPRYVDCGNGTVTDNKTGLVWLADANCLDGRFDWFTAMEFVAGLSDKPATSSFAAIDCGLSDGSSPGEWRLPSVEEWEAMVADAVDLGCTFAGGAPPTITNDSGSTCWVIGPSSFFSVKSGTYWSSSSWTFGLTFAISAGLETGNTALRAKTESHYV